MRIALSFAIQLILATIAFAQTSMDATKENGAQGDPRNAIRSLGGTGNGDKGPTGDAVRIPNYVGHIGHAADQLPPGTSRPGSGPTYVAPR